MQVSAQTQGRVPTAEQSEHYTWWYVTLFALMLALTAVAVWMLKTKKAEKEAGANIFIKEKMMSDDNAWDANSAETDKETDGHRRHKRKVGKALNKGSKKKSLAEGLPRTDNIFSRAADSEEVVLEASEVEIKEELQPIRFNQLPIFKFQKIEPARPYAALSISNDDALMCAVEQTQDEFGDDEEVRDLSVRILARFKTRNSIEALSQIALYDLSSNLRSKAVTTLADFDHESVFETILQGCADSTREVRAAAARGLFRLSFDRADAWTGIAETGDDFRMRRAVQAAKKADLVKRSFGRLVHPDHKIAYEAVTLLALMIRAGETDDILTAIVSHQDGNVKLALLHVIGLTKDEDMLSQLHSLLETAVISKELKDKIDDVIKTFRLVAA